AGDGRRSVGSSHAHAVVLAARQALLLEQQKCAVRREMRTRGKSQPGEIALGGGTRQASADAVQVLDAFDEPRVIVGRVEDDDGTRSRQYDACAGGRHGGYSPQLVVVADIRSRNNHALTVRRLHKALETSIFARQRS